MKKKTNPTKIVAIIYIFIFAAIVMFIVGKL